MIRTLVITCLAGAAGLVAAAEDDLLRFTNGDQLHGTFQGIKEGPVAVWQRGDTDAPVMYKIPQIRQVVLRGGRPVKSLSSLSHAALVNGDRIPGEIVGLDDKSVTLETAFAGTLRFPREQVGMLAPRPLGGRVFYHGPFSADDWEMIHPKFPKGLPAAPAADAKIAEDEPGRWAYSGAAWYWQGKRPGTALVRREGMPDRSILRFDLAWKNRPSVAIAFHADFKRPEQGAEEKEGVQQFTPGDPGSLPYLFGNSYILHLYQNYVMLYRSSFAENGNPVFERVQPNSNNIKLGESGKAKVEIRCNRSSGEISLFIEDEFVVQWNEITREEDGGGYAGKGSGFGFAVQMEGAPVRISEVTLAEWNGMPDSARSLQVDDQDIVLLANGTDRFSGRIETLKDGNIRLQGRYGEFEFPLDDIAEVRFARQSLAKPPEESNDNVIVRYHPLGRVSGRPLGGDASSLKLLGPAAGEMDLNLESAVILDFQPSNSFLDDWDPQF